MLVLWRFQSPRQRLPQQKGTQTPASRFRSTGRGGGGGGKRVSLGSKGDNRQGEKENSVLSCLSVSGIALQDVEIQGKTMDGKHLIVTCTIFVGPKSVRTYALIDCGATGLAFVDEEFAHHHQLPLRQLKQPRNLEVIDGRPIASGAITHIA